MKKNNDLLKNTVFLAIGTLLTKGLQFVMVPFFAKWLSVEDYGIFDLICTYVILAIPIVSFSTTQSIFRFALDEKKEGKKNIISNGLFIYVINTIIFSIFLVAISCFIKINYILPFLLLFVSQVINDYFQGVLRGLKKLNIYSLAMAFSSLFIAVFSVIFIKLFNLGLDGILLGYSLGYFVGDLFIFLAIKFWTIFSIKEFDVKTIVKMFKYSYILIFNDISWWIVNVSDRTIIKFFIGNGANGIYAIANKIPALCSSVFGMFSISWQQTASEIVNDKDKEKYINSVFSSSTSTILSLCIGIISCNYFLFKFVFPSNYFSAYYHTPILVAAIIFNSISQFLGGIHISFKNPKENGVSTVLAAFLNVAINLIFIKVIGLFAASISTLVANVFIVLFRKYRLRNKIKLRFNLETYFYFVIFMYYFICQYVFVNCIYINVINFIVAVILFIIINRNIVFAILKKFNIMRS